MNEVNGAEHQKSMLWKYIKAGAGIILFVLTLFRLMNSESDDVRVWTMLILLVAFFITHLVAIAKVKKGELTVYRDWMDFGLSFAWIIAIPIGAALYGEGGFLPVTFAVIFFLIGLCCLGWLIIGAFANNKGSISNAIIALVSRITATAFTISYVSKWLDFLNKKDEMTLQQWIAATINLMIFGWILKALLLPVIKDNRNLIEEATVENAVES